MKTFLKHLLPDFVIVFGNIFLSHGLFFAWDGIINFLQGSGIDSDIIQPFTLLIMCTLQISINILLYKTLLKKFFEPPEQKKPALYFLLPIIPYVIWTVAFRVSVIAGYTYGIETYIRLLISFMPIILITLIPITIAYCLYFYKYIGEAYYVYMLSFFGVTVIPITITLCVITLG